jgi:hypothetical protein
VGKFDGGAVTSNAGALLLREADRIIGLTRRPAGAIPLGSIRVALCTRRRSQTDIDHHVCRMPPEERMLERYEPQDRVEIRDRWQGKIRRRLKLSTPSRQGKRKRLGQVMEAKHSPTQPFENLKQALEHCRTARQLRSVLPLTSTIMVQF